MQNKNEIKVGYESALQRVYGTRGQHTQKVNDRNIIMQKIFDVAMALDKVNIYGVAEMKFLNKICDERNCILFERRAMRDAKTNRRKKTKLKQSHRSSFRRKPVKGMMMEIIEKLFGQNKAFNRQGT